jgi:alkylhydroperoxidase family enzyme
MRYSRSVPPLVRAAGSTQEYVGLVRRDRLGKLGATLGEQIAVAVAYRDACNYCLAAHILLGRRPAPAQRR